MLPIERAERVVSAWRMGQRISDEEADDLTQMIDEAIWDAITADRVDRNAPQTPHQVVVPPSQF